MGAPEGGSRGGRRRTSGAANLSEVGGVPESVPSLAVFAGRGFDDGCLNAFWAAVLSRVVRNAVSVQAPASAFWFLLLLFVVSILIQVFRAVSSLVVLVKSVKMLQPAVLMSQSWHGCRALFRRWSCRLLCHEPWAVWCREVVPSSLVEDATVSSNHPIHDLVPSSRLPSPTLHVRPPHPLHCRPPPH